MEESLYQTARGKSEELSTNLSAFFTETTPSVDATAIQYQTSSIEKDIQKAGDTANLYIEKARHQFDMYNAIKFVNRILLAIYIIVFTFIHILFLQQYFSGVKRNETADFFWLCVFFFYPYLIYYVESKIYFAITYMLSFLYGQTYVYKFDKLLLFDNYYMNDKKE